MRCSCFCLNSASKEFAARVHSVKKSSAFLRHSPPNLYVTAVLHSYDMNADDDTASLSETLKFEPTRHKTILMDVAVNEYQPPQTYGAYLLSSTVIDDMEYKNATATLVGLPTIREETESQHFLDDILIPSLKDTPIKNISHVVLPEITLGCGHVVKHLYKINPNTRFVCSAFARAFLTDSNFFEGTCKVLAINDGTQQAKVNQVFSGIPYEACIVPEGGEPLTLANDPQSHRKFTIFAAESTVLAKKQQNNKKPSFFEEKRLLLHDSAFSALLVGSALVRLPWLRCVMAEANLSAILPIAPMMSSQFSSDHPLLTTWKVEDSVSTILDIPHLPLVRRVLSSHYGELPGDLGDVMNSAEESALKLKELRSRLGRKLIEDPKKDVTRWAPSMTKKIISEIIATNTAKEKTSEEMMNRIVSWGCSNFIGRTAAALSKAALVLPPTELKTVSTDSDTNKSSSNKDSDLEGPKGIELMKSILEKKGLNSLAKVSVEQDIDVHVFLSMSENDFKTVFKATFGLINRLKQLQHELRSALNKS